MQKHFAFEVRNLAIKSTKLLTLESYLFINNIMLCCKNYYKPLTLI
jgi:hypothetical protein